MGKPHFARLFFVALLLLLPKISQSQTIEIGDLRFYIESNAHTAQIAQHCGNEEGTYSIVVPESIEYNGSEYPVTSIGKSAFRNCRSLTSITIPNSVTSIGNFAFEGCTSLEKLTFEDGEETLSLGYQDENVFGKGLFYYCPIDTLYLGRNLSYKTDEKYGYSPFYNIKTLRSVIIGNSVTSIGEYAFGNCQDLVEIKNLAITPPIIWSSSFNDFCYTNAIIYVPIGTKNDYESKWKDFSHIIEIGYKNELTIEIDEPGTLINKIKPSEAGNVTGLTLKGQLNGTDLLTINRMNNLISLDLSMATIVEGGMPYYEEDIKKWETTADELGEKWAYNLNILRNLKLPTNLKALGDYALSHKRQLMEIEIPNSVASIGEYAFYKSSIQKLIIEDSKETLSMGNYCFNYCDIDTLYMGRNYNYTGYMPLSPIINIRSAIIGNSVTSISDFPFQECSVLTSVSIGNSVTSIGDFAFYECSGLTSVSIGNSVTSIGDCAFDGCYGLTSITIPNSVTSIGDSAFKGCWALTSITIPNSVTSIGRSAFVNCVALTSFTIPNSVTSIEDYTFAGCNGLTSITIPNSVTSIGNGAFEECWDLKELTFEDGEETLSLGKNNTKEGLFYDCPIDTLYLGRNLSCYIGPFSNTLRSVIISNHVTFVGRDAFTNCTELAKAEFACIESLCNIEYESFSSNPLSYAKHIYINGEEVTDLVIPVSVTSIKDYTFTNCSSLSSILLPDGVTDIGTRAFSGCSALNEITLPGSMRNIGNGAFEGCTGLRKVNVINPIPPVISSSTFPTSLTTAATLHVPDGSESIYWIHPYWGNFGTIENLEPTTVGETTQNGITYHVTSEKDATVEVVGSSVGASRAGEVAITIPRTIIISNRVYRVTGIGNSSFAKSPVTSIDMPATISYVGLEAFKGATNLRTVKCRAALPPSIHSNSFDENTYNNAVLSVQKTTDAYENHDVWSLFNVDKSLSSIFDIPDDDTPAITIDGNSIVINAEDGVEVFLYNLTGSLIHRSTKHRIDNLMPGTYIIRARSIAEKIMVK